MKKILSGIALLSLTVGVAAEPGFSAKAIFTGSDDKLVSVRTAPAERPGVNRPVRLAMNKQIGVKYYIRMKNSDGTFTNVLASRHFKSGERFQLGLQVDRPTYVYISNEDAKGKVVQLYPRNGQSGRVDAMGTVYLPSEGAFEFDVEPGIEQLTVVLAQSPQTQVDRFRTMQADFVSDPGAVKGPTSCASDQSSSSASSSAINVNPSTDGNHMIASADTGYAGKGILRSDDPACSPPPAYAAKGILVTNDPAPAAGEQPASYVVKPVVSTSDTLTLKLKLLHT